jgi:protein gp37
MGEYFDPHVHPDWEAQVWKVMRENPQHIFQILTKQPSRAVASRFSENVWLGMSVDGKTANLTGQMIFSKHPHQQKFVSFEPLLGPVLPYLENIKWVIIGSKTGPRPEQPKKEWVQAIIDQARKQNTPVFLKDNLEWPEKIQEWPAEMRAIVEGQ